MIFSHKRQFFIYSDSASAVFIPNNLNGFCPFFEKFSGDQNTFCPFIPFFSHDQNDFCLFWGNFSHDQSQCFS